jgi:hypothetical protein
MPSIHRSQVFRPNAVARSASLLSLAALATGIAVWPSLFLFSKVLHLPPELAGLPYPLTTRLLFLVCLAVPVLTWNSPKQAVKWTLAVWLLSPLVALVSQPPAQSQPVANLVFHYLWVLGYHGALPLLAVLGIRASVRFLRTA